MHALRDWDRFRRWKYLREERFGGPPFFPRDLPTPEQGDGDGLFLEKAGSISGAAKNKKGKSGRKKKRESKAVDAAGASAAAAAAGVAVMAVSADNVRRKDRTVCPERGVCNDGTRLIFTHRTAIQALGRSLPRLRQPRQQLAKVAGTSRKTNTARFI